MVTVDPKTCPERHFEASTKENLRLREPEKIRLVGGGGVVKSLSRSPNLLDLHCSKVPHGSLKTSQNLSRPLSRSANIADFHWRKLPYGGLHRSQNLSGSPSGSFPRLGSAISGASESLRGGGVGPGTWERRTWDHTHISKYNPVLNVDY